MKSNPTTGTFSARPAPLVAKLYAVLRLCYRGLRPCHQGGGLRTWPCPELAVLQRLEPRSLAHTSPSAVMPFSLSGSGGGGGMTIIYGEWCDRGAGVGHDRWFSFAAVPRVLEDCGAAYLTTFSNMCVVRPRAPRQTEKWLRRGHGTASNTPLLFFVGRPALSRAVPVADLVA